MCEEKSFQRWITVEKKFAQERIDVMLSSASAWKSPQTELTDVSAFSSTTDSTDAVEGSLYEAVGVSSLRVPECVESFVTQLFVLRERSASLPGS